MTGLTSSTGHSPASAYRSASDYDRQLTENDMRANAWHYFGYPTLSAYMSSSNDFFLLRRFSRASAHCLLYQQHEIAKRGKDLDAWDELARGCKPDGSGASDSFEKDPIKERTEIIKELIPLLREYHGFVNSFSEIKAKPTARQYHIGNLENWLKTHPYAVLTSEQHFKDPKTGHLLEGDLFPIVSKDRSPLRLVVDRWRWLRFQFRLGQRNDRIESDHIAYTSEKGLDCFTNMLILVLGLALLFGLIWWLNFVADDVHRLAIITGFITAFTCVVWAAVGQRPLEILAATAAYAAVLMVFLQNDNGGSGGVTATNH